MYIGMVETSRKSFKKLGQNVSDVTDKTSDNGRRLDESFNVRRLTDVSMPFVFPI